MIGKLLKHEFLRTGPTVGMIIGITSLVAIGGILTAAVNWPLISVLGTILSVIAITILVPAVQLYLGIDYWMSGYRRLGYFTQTIPVKGSTIYWGKLLWAFLVSLITVVVTTILGLFFLWVGTAPYQIDPSASGFDLIGVLWSGVYSAFPGGYLAIPCFFGLLALMLPQIQLFFMASAGSREPLNRWSIGGPVLIGVILYFAWQMINLLLIFFVPLGVDFSTGPAKLVSINWLSSIMENTTSTVAPFGFIPFIVLLPLGLMWWTARSWNKGATLT